VSPHDAQKMVAMRPTERIRALCTDAELGQQDAAGRVDDVLKHYTTFLKETDASEDALIERFLDAEKSRQYFEQANELGNAAYELLRHIGQDSRFLRLLFV
jgi:uncharacterized protein YdbL (DUF1318 family)